MLRFTHKLPDKPYSIAVSGGPDSMSVLDFLQGHRIKPSVIHCHHGTKHADEAATFVGNYCGERRIPLQTFHISCWREKKSEESWEEYWREFRLAKLLWPNGNEQMPVITAHNLNDCMENWIFTSLHGESKLLPYRHHNIIRPFRATPKADMLDWCERHKVPYLLDPSNQDTRYMRNHIRHKLMPEALVVNPGLAKVILKKVLKDAELP